MLNSKVNNKNKISKEDLVDFESAIDNYKNFSNIQQELNKINNKDQNLLTFIFYNTKTKKFFLEPNKFNQYSIILFNYLDIYEEFDIKSYKDIEKFKKILKKQLTLIILDEKINRLELLKKNIVSLDRVVTDFYNDSSWQDTIKQYFLKLISGEIANYSFDIYRNIPLKLNSALNFKDKVLDIYVSSKISFLKNFKNNKSPIDKNKYQNELYDLFLISNLRFEELNKETRLSLKIFFKNKYYKLLDLDYLFLIFKFEIFSTSFSINFVEKGGNPLEVVSDEKWLKIYSHFKDISLKDKIRYKLSFLTNLGSKKFTILNKFIN